MGMNGQVAQNGQIQGLEAIFARPEVGQLVATLQQMRWTGRPGYPIVVMVRTLIAKIAYQLPCVTQLVRFLRDHAELRAACGISSADQIPSIDAHYRFMKKLRASNALEETLQTLVARIATSVPDFGKHVAVDATDIEAYSRPTKKPKSDPDAAVGVRRAKLNTEKPEFFFGYTLSLMVDANHQVPIAWSLAPANVSDMKTCLPLFETARGRFTWFRPTHAILDKGYDDSKIHEALETTYGIHPIIPLRQFSRESGSDLDEQGVPVCPFGHGRFSFRGADYRNRRTKWRCAPCRVTMWLKLKDNYRKHSLVPRHTRLWGKLYARRSAVEREFSLLKEQVLLDTVRARGIERVKLHVNLCLLVRLLKAASALNCVPTKAA